MNHASFAIMRGLLHGMVCLMQSDYLLGGKQVRLHCQVRPNRIDTPAYQQQQI